MAAPMARLSKTAKTKRKLSFNEAFQMINNGTEETVPSDSDTDSSSTCTSNGDNDWAPSKSDCELAENESSDDDDDDEIVRDAENRNDHQTIHSTSTYGDDAIPDQNRQEQIEGNSTESRPEPGQNPEKRGRKRKCDPSKWKRNVKACKRLRGEEYVGHNGIVHTVASEGDPCNCKKRCFDSISAETRESLRNKYYSLPDFSAQRFFISNFITVKQPARKYAGVNSRRKVTYEYSIVFNSQTVYVCKKALASILGIRVAKINYVCDLIKKDGTPHEDRRGKHENRPNKIANDKKEMVLNFIDSIPRYRSHYTRRHNPHRYYLSPALTIRKCYDMYVEKITKIAEEPVSFRVFSDLFTKERNLHFGQPSLDTCKDCDKFTMKLQADPDDTETSNMKEIHLRKADAAQTKLKSDFEIAKNDKTYWTIAFDFQQTLPTPHINTSVTFYSRQMWTYNLGIHDSERPVMNMWAEDVAGRGSCEVISSLNTYFKDIDIANKHLVAWSDSCGGQNKNKNMISFWYYLVHVKKQFDSIVHKFPIPGHTFLPCDRDFGVIEKKKKKTPAVYTPTGWFDLVRESRRQNPFKVVQMTQNENFVDIEPMKSRLNFRTTALDGSKVSIQKAQRIKVQSSHPGYMFIGYTHNDEESWQQVNISGQRGIIGNLTLPKLYMARRKIAAPKLNDLKKLCDFIPIQFRHFYRSLQASVPSPRKLRNGEVSRVTSSANNVSSGTESEEETYSEDSDVE